MAPSIPLEGIDPDEDYKKFPKVVVEEEYFHEWVDVTNQLRSREEWGAKPPTRAPTDRPLFDPVRYIVLSSFYTRQEGQPNRASVMQELQRRDMENRGLHDIQSNWVFGEDGLVYEGRNWVFRPGNSALYPGFEGRYAEFTFIGDYKGDHYEDAFCNVITKFNCRAEWKAARPTRKDKSLSSPIPYVVFSSLMVTGAERSLTSAELVKKIQERDMSLGMADIQCNFIVTEDGLVWEGRGWDVRPGCDSDYPGYEGKFCEITNVGDFATSKVRKSTAHLVDIGMLYLFLDRNLIQLGPDKRRKGVIATQPPCPFEATDNAPTTPSIIQ